LVDEKSINIIKEPSAACWLQNKEKKKKLKCMFWFYSTDVLDWNVNMTTY
jgi:hypothetical protein